MHQTFVSFRCRPNLSRPSGWWPHEALLDHTRPGLAGHRREPDPGHGGSIIKVDGTFYWYGENKERTTPGSGVRHWGVRCYSSTGLYDWTDRGLIVPPDVDDPTSPLPPARSMDRPHILRHPVSGAVRVLGQGDVAGRSAVHRADRRDELRPKHRDLLILLFADPRFPTRRSAANSEFPPGASARPAPGAYESLRWCFESRVCRRPK
jgi:hypothetical protein